MTENKHTAMGIIDEVLHRHSPVAENWQAMVRARAVNAARWAS